MKSSPKNLKSIKLLTYNVFLRPPPIKTNEDDYKNQRIDDILQEIKNYDIICFQEMFQTATFRKEKVIERALTLGFLYWKDCQAPAFWQGPPVDSGLLVISKFPILYSHFESYKVGVLSDSASDKGYIYCKIDVNGKILHLFTTHLQASYLHPGMLYERELSIKTRLHQLRHLLKKILQLLKKHAKMPQIQLVMLLGDLNMNALMEPMMLHDKQRSVLWQQKVGQHFNEYDTFMKIFKDFKIKATDCGLESYKRHPITFGDGDLVLTDNLESLSQQRLDFIFHLQVPVERQINTSEEKCIQGKLQTKVFLSAEQLENQKVLRPIIDSTRVQEFKIKDRKYTQLSDHYGVSINIAVQ